MFSVYIIFDALCHILYEVLEITNCQRPPKTDLDDDDDDDVWKLFTIEQLQENPAWSDNGLKLSFSDNKAVCKCILLLKQYKENYFEM